MTRKIEADGFITQETDLKQTKLKACATCKHRKIDDVLRKYRCSVGHLIDVADWRMKYEVCDKWEQED